jgi:N6-adenosine-specific RNA methylase IME4
VTRYPTVVADPPWPIEWSTGKTRVNGRGERHVNHKQRLGYAVMSIEDICALEIPAADDAHLYLWATDTHLLDGSASRVARAWGFTPHKTLVWRKASYGLGKCWRPAHEIVVLARRGDLDYRGESIATVQDWKQPYVATGRSVAKLHSAKPDGFLDMVEVASPGPYLELFARRARFGWDYWGDESLGTAEFAA